MLQEGCLERSQENEKWLKFNGISEKGCLGSVDFILRIFVKITVSHLFGCSLFCNASF